MRVVQSNEQFLMNGVLDIQVSVTKRLQGGVRGRKNKAPITNPQKRKLKKSIILIKNTGNLQ